MLAAKSCVWLIVSGTTITKKIAMTTQQPEENDRDGERLGHVPFQARRDRLDAKRDKGGDHEDRDRSRYVPGKPKRERGEHDGARDRADPSPEIAAYSGLHRSRRSVR